MNLYFEMTFSLPSPLSLLNDFLKVGLLVHSCYQEIIKVREVIPHTGPIPIVIPLRLFLDDINFPADNVTARVTWKFRGGGKVQQILYDATLRFQN